MNTDPYKKVRAHILNAHTHIQMSDANATDPNIIEALGEILDSLRILVKEADDADTAIRNMSRP